ncbi:hypothetical protein that often co-occurs with aconitase [hydrothermal vent metagenome]|uniref:DUF1223 domain-containing protein n=1 Tax=hydrothermal vent metagenome TaxID=652676 RepID=A0A3B0S417_9ZZZZ
MRRLLFLLPILALLNLVGMRADGEVAASATHPVLVELFTSQGCVNCPKANRLLAELASDPNVIALSLAVDYWDYLGWKDTFAMSDFTRRQRAYGKHLQARRPYTPQIIVDGKVLIKGINQSKIRKTIKRLSGKSATGPQISLTNIGDQMRLEISEGTAPKEGAVILIADYIPGVQKIKIAAGENKGKELDQVNMVTKLRPIGIWNGEAMTINIPAITDGSCIAILQENGPGRVLAVTRLAG